MANNYFDTTGVLTFRDKATATPVISALFSAFDLDTKLPGDNQAYIARISEGTRCCDWPTCAPVLLPAGRLFQRDWFARKRPLVSTGTRPSVDVRPRHMSDGTGTESCRSRKDKTKSPQPQRPAADQQPFVWASSSLGLWDACPQSVAGRRACVGAGHVSHEPKLLRSSARGRRLAASGENGR